MRIIIKFVLKNIKEKKFRSFLILFSIMLSSALFFASMAIVGTMENMYAQRIKAPFGNAEIIFHKGDNGDSPLFSESKLNAYKNHMEYIVGSISTRGFYSVNRNEVINLDLKGFELEDLDLMNPIEFKHPVNHNSFHGKKIIISSLRAKKHSLSPGNKIDIEINGNKFRFEIAGIAESTGLFQESASTMTGLIPKKTLASLLDARGRINMLYLKPKDNVNTDNIIDEISKENTRYIAKRPITISELNQHVQRITTPFMMTTTIVLFMSVFIIYTSFKVITMERLPIIGTFRSVGATRKMTDFVLTIESLLYGILGGILGCGFGLGVLYIMTYLMSEDPWAGTKMEVKIDFTSGQLVGALLLAIILSIISSIIPIVKASKIPVKDIVLNKFQTSSSRKPWKLYLGIIFLMVSLIVPWFMPKSLALILGIVCMLLVVTSLVLLVPYITNIFLRVFEKVYNRIFGNEGVIAVKNLRNNKSILNNISLLAIGISSLLMINTISYSVITEISSFYSDADFEVWMWAPEADREFDTKIKTVDGVEDVYGVIGANMVNIADSDHTINLIHGVDENKFLDFWEMDVAKGDLNRLKDGRYILLTYALRDKFEVDIGDTLSLKLQRGERSYIVSGFFDSLRWNGNYAMVSERFLKSDMGNGYYQDIYLKTTKDPNVVVKSIKSKFARIRPTVTTVAEMEGNDQKSNAQLFTILKGFSIMTLVIGVFGVLNNLIISFIQRKRSLAIYRSLGMSKSQIIKMIFIEALTGGIIGGTMGIIAGFLMVAIMPNIMKAMDSPIPMHYSFQLFFYSLIAGIAIKVVASISPALRSSKLNIVEAIKYE